jgi:hypothetical protein
MAMYTSKPPEVAIELGLLKKGKQALQRILEVKASG